MQRHHMKGIWLIPLVVIALSLPTDAHALTVTYGYDRAGRLIGAGYDTGKIIFYNYDNAGNLLSRVVGSIEPGNVFIDQSIDLKDAILALQVSCRLKGAGFLIGGDVNGDRKIGLAEAVYVLQILGEIRE